MKKKNVIISGVGLLILLTILILQLIPAQYPASATLFGKKQLQIAHRGLSSLYPELSEDAYIAAGEAGFYAAECDVHTTSDGKIILMHDDSVDRTTNGTGEIKNLSFKDILKLNIDTGNGIDKCKNKKILQFDEYLNICEQYDMVPYIELKDLDICYLPDLLSFIEDYNLKEKAVLISFNEEYLAATRELDSEIRIMLLVGKIEQEDIEFCVKYNCGLDFDFLRLGLSLKAFASANDKNIPLAAWTVDWPLISDFLHLNGVDYITTNRLIP